MGDAEKKLAAIEAHLRGYGITVRLNDEGVPRWRYEDGVEWDSILVAISDRNDDYDSDYDDDWIDDWDDDDLDDDFDDDVPLKWI